MDSLENTPLILPPDGTGRKRKPTRAPLVCFVVVIVLLMGALTALRLWRLEEIVIDLPQNTTQEEDSSPAGKQDSAGSSTTTSSTTSEITIPRGGTTDSVQLTLAPAEEEKTYQEIYAALLPAIVCIQASDSTGTSSGTGVIFHTDGYIVTNTHVISGCSAATVLLYDGATYDATLVGYDESSDIAVLKIEASGLVAATFGDSDLAQVGDQVLAIGNPLGSTFFGTMTEGIISAVNRNLSVNGYTMSLIQTTAALNSGNSGGALVNMAGQVIGITNSKMTSTYSTLEGLGFAIPSTCVKEVVDVLVARGELPASPSIGITGMSSAIPAKYDVAGQGTAVEVVTVTEGSPAQVAGVEVGDFILSANGTTVTTVEELRTLRDEAGVGGTLELTILREGKLLKLSLVLTAEE